MVDANQKTITTYSIATYVEDSGSYMELLRNMKVFMAPEELKPQTGFNVFQYRTNAIEVSWDNKESADYFYLYYSENGPYGDYKAYTNKYGRYNAFFDGSEKLLEKSHKQ